MRMLQNIENQPSKFQNLKKTFQNIQRNMINKILANEHSLLWKYSMLKEITSQNHLKHPQNIFKAITDRKIARESFKTAFRERNYVISIIY